MVDKDLEHRQLHVAEVSTLFSDFLVYSRMSIGCILHVMCAPHGLAREVSRKPSRCHEARMRDDEISI